MTSPSCTLRNLQNLSYLLWLLPRLSKMIGLNHFSSSSALEIASLVLLPPSNPLEIGLNIPIFQPSINREIFVGQPLVYEALVSPLYKTLSLPMFIKLSVSKCPRDLEFHACLQPFTTLIQHQNPDSSVHKERKERKLIFDFVPKGCREHESNLGCYNYVC